MDKDYIVEHVKTLIESVEQQRTTSLAEEFVNYEEVADLNKIIIEACGMLTQLGVGQEQYAELEQEASALRVRVSELQVMLERANQSANDWARRHHEIAHKLHEKSNPKGDYNVGYWKEKALKGRAEIKEKDAELERLHNVIRAAGIDPDWDGC